MEVVVTSFFPEVGVGAAAAACLGCCLSSVSRSTPEANLFPVGSQYFAVEKTEGSSNGAYLS